MDTVTRRHRQILRNWDVPSLADFSIYSWTTRIGRAYARLQYCKHKVCRRSDQKDRTCGMGGPKRDLWSANPRKQRPNRKKRRPTREAVWKLAVERPNGVTTQWPGGSISSERKRRIRDQIRPYHWSRELCRQIRRRHHQTTDWLIVIHDVATNPKRKCNDVIDILSHTKFKLICRCFCRVWGICLCEKKEKCVPVRGCVRVYPWRHR